MKKTFLLFTAALVAMAANAKVTTISPDEENDALRLAVHYAEDGDIIEMTEGTYVQKNSGYVAFDGKAVTVRAAEGANVVLQLQVPITLANGAKATLENIKFDASRLRELANWYDHVIYANDATEGKELVMEGCEVYGFNINNSVIYSKADNKLDLCKINNCYFHDNMKSCFFFQGESLGKLSLTNSTFANIATDQSGYYAGIIDVRATVAIINIDHCTFYNCVAKGTDYGAVTVKHEDGAAAGPADAIISNSIFVSPKSQSAYRAIYVSDKCSGAQANNCLTYNYGASKNGIRSACVQTNCIVADPLFADTTNGNFALAEGSPALTAGTDGKAIGDPRWNAPAEEEKPEGISYELNGGVLPAPAVPTQDSLIAAFKDGYNAYFGVSVATTRAIDNFLYAGAAVNDPTCDVSLFMKDDASPWKWLGDYVLAVTNAQIEAGLLVNLKELATELMWRQSLTGFFLQQALSDSNYKGNANFTEAGKPENWGAAYQAAHAVVLPTEPVDAPYTLPTPVKEGYTFVGWYDNAEGTGEAYTVIPASWSGTLYAIWEVQGPTTALENIAVEGKAVKTIINGQLIIIKNGVQYNALGQAIK